MQAVTNGNITKRRRWFEVKHLGDITKISGYTAPTVDVIIGGSPC